MLIAVVVTLVTDNERVTAMVPPVPEMSVPLEAATVHTVKFAERGVGSANAALPTRAAAPVEVELNAVPVVFTERPETTSDQAPEEVNVAAGHHAEGIGRPMAEAAADADTGTIRRSRKVVPNETLAEMEA